MRHMGDVQHRAKAAVQLTGPAMASSASNSMMSDVEAGGAAIRGGRYDDDDEPEVGCMGAKGGDKDVLKSVQYKRRIMFVVAAGAVVLVVLFGGAAAVLMDDESSSAAAGALSYTPKDALRGGGCSDEALFKFAESSGIDTHKVGVGEFPCAQCEGGKRRGLKAKIKIMQGEEIVTAEWRGVISAEKSMGELEGVASVAGGMAPKERLALLLMFHRFKPDSPLRPYLCSMPLTYDSPFLWEDGKLLKRYDKSSDMFVQVVSHRMHAVQQYNKYFTKIFKEAPSLFDAKLHTAEVWAWALQTVRARNWAVNRREGGDASSPIVISHAMVPVADLVNARMSDGGGGKTSKDRAKFTLVSGGNYSEGEEVFSTYGDQCNAYYRLVYGFEFEGNELKCKGDVVSESKSWKDEEAQVVWTWVTKGIGDAPYKEAGLHLY